MTLVDYHCKLTVIISSIITLTFAEQNKKFEDMPRTNAQGRGRGQFYEASPKPRT